MANDNNGNYDFFVRDVVAGTTVAVSVDQNGVPVSGLTLYTPVALSGDGRYVAFISSDANILTGDDNGTSDVFVRDLQTGTTTLVSVGATGEVGNAASGQGIARQSLAISPNGRFVGFFRCRDEPDPQLQ